MTLAHSVRIAAKRWTAWNHTYLQSSRPSACVPCYTFPHSALKWAQSLNWNAPLFGAGVGHFHAVSRSRTKSKDNRKQYTQEQPVGRSAPAPLRHSFAMLRVATGDVATACHAAGCFTNLFSCKISGGIRAAGVSKLDEREGDSRADEAPADAGQQHPSTAGSKVRDRAVLL